MHTLPCPKEAIIQSFIFIHSSIRPFIKHCVPLLCSRHCSRSWGFSKEPLATNNRTIPSAGKYFDAEARDGWVYALTSLGGDIRNDGSRAECP